MNISKENLTLIGRAVSRLASFQKELMQDKSFAGKAKSMYPNLTDVNKEDNYSLLIYDLIKCYKGLGHDMDIDSKESIGLLLLISKRFDATDFIYSNLNTVIDTIRGNYDTVVKAVSPQVDKLPKHYDFLIANVLTDINRKDKRKQYYVLLFRLCSLISKIDGKEDETESKWLATLLKVSEGKEESMNTTVSSVDDIDNTRGSSTDSKSNFMEGKGEDNRTNELLPIQNRMMNSEAIKELDSLTGLSGVKEQIHSLMNYSMVQMMREARGMKKIPLSLHCVFSGNPGTGKTTVARLIGRIYKDLGLLETGELVETDRGGLVAEYIGQTAAKTNDVIDEAIGGVLFIDEAYSLINGSKEDYGHEAIATLLKRMEDERDKFVVILAGYTDKMSQFLDSNPGLQSRFSRKIIFEE